MHLNLIRNTSIWKSLEPRKIYQNRWEAPSDVLTVGKDLLRASASCVFFFLWFQVMSKKHTLQQSFF